MTTGNTHVHRGGYTLDLKIPVEWWSGTDTLQTERLRARRRAWVLAYAKNEWRNLKKQGKAWKVERFIALIAVAYPTRGHIFPARAAETVKPIIDGGSDARLWDDDDSSHRHSTVYIQLPGDPANGHYRITVLIIPVSDRNPKYQIAGGIGMETARQWASHDDKPAWADGYMVSFDIPDRQWITSNYTDSDLAARQKGAKKATHWGTGRTLGVRERVNGQLETAAVGQWRTQAYCGYERFIVLAGVAYPYGVGKADPDNSAETVNTLLEAGTQVGAWRDMTSKHCNGVAFFRLPNLKRGHMHTVRLFILPVPPEFQLAEAIADSAEQSWAEHDRRHR